MKRQAKHIIFTIAIFLLSFSIIAANISTPVSVLANDTASVNGAVAYGDTNLDEGNRSVANEDGNSNSENDTEPTSASISDNASEPQDEQVEPEEQPENAAVSANNGIANAPTPTAAGDGTVPFAVSTFAELKSALSDTAITKIQITENISFPETLAISRDIILIGANESIIINSDTLNDSALFKISGGTTVHFEQLTLDGENKNYSIDIFDTKQTNLEIINCIFKNNKDSSTRYGGAITYESNGNILIQNSTFIDNEATEKFGGAMYIVSNNGAIDLAIKDSEFKTNRASYGGAVSYMGYGSVDITNTQLVNNAAINSDGDGGGGALYIFPNQSMGVDISISTSTITGNTGEYFAGGLLVSGNNVQSNSKLNISNTTFSENSASMDTGSGLGGAISLMDIDNLDVSIIDSEFSTNTSRVGAGITTGNFFVGNLNIENTTFKSNHSKNGSSLYYNGKGTATISSSTFLQNTATSFGGAIAIAPYNVDFNIENSVFTENKAVSGGAIFALPDGESLSLSITGGSFEKNEAEENGGGIYMGADPVKVSITDTNFINNKALDGKGGATYFLNGNVTVDGGSYMDNTATDGGGAIFIDSDDETTQDKIHLTIKNARFERNTTTNRRAWGGAVYSGESRNVGDDYLTIENTVFDSNKTSGSSGHGGAVFTDGNTILTNVTFTNNSATGSSSDGGGIYLRNGTLLADNVIATNNTAASTGGAIIMDAADFATITNSKFSDNQAGSGAAIYIAKNKAITITATSFENNKTLKENGDGGAVYTLDSKLLIDGSTFKNNKAGRWGGALAIYGSSNYQYKAQVQNSSFESNITQSATKPERSIGGAIYLTESPLEISGATKFIQNEAYSGGAIYTTTLADVYADTDVVFENNKAHTAHTVTNDEDKALHASNILTNKFTSLTDSNGIKIGFQYAYSNYDINYEGDYPFVVIKLDAASGDPIAGVKFELTKEDGTLIAEKATDADGRIDFFVSEIGTYTLTETEAADGYVANTSPLSITIDGTDNEANSNMSIIVKNEKIQKFTVTYDGNGNTSGTAPVDTTGPYTADSTVSVLGNSLLVKEGYTFTGWNTKTDGSGIHYNENETFVITADIVLYAQWEPIYVSSSTSSTSPTPSTPAASSVASTSSTASSHQTPQTGDVALLYPAVLLLFISSSFIVFCIIALKKKKADAN